MGRSKLFLFFDGGFLPQNRTAHGGVVYAFNGPERIRFGFGLIMPPGVDTNNKAEYFAINWGIAYLLKQPLPFAEDIVPPVDLYILGDSELVIKQLKGEYGVNTPALKKLHKFANHLLTLLKDHPLIEGVELIHIQRNCNRAADYLGRAAVKKGYSFNGLLTCENKAPCPSLQNQHVCSKPKLLSAKRINL